MPIRRKERHSRPASFSACWRRQVRPFFHIWDIRIDRYDRLGDSPDVRRVVSCPPAFAISIKEFAMFYRRELSGLFAVVLGFLPHNAARADQIFLANVGNGTIGEYTTAGATVNLALISAL